MDEKLKIKKKIYESKPAKGFVSFLHYGQYFELIFNCILVIFSIILIITTLFFGWPKWYLSLGLLIISIWGIILSIKLIKYLKIIRKKQEDKTFITKDSTKIMKDKKLRIARGFLFIIGFALIFYGIYSNYINPDFKDNFTLNMTIIITFLVLLAILGIYFSKRLKKLKLK